MLLGDEYGLIRVVTNFEFSHFSISGLGARHDARHNAFKSISSVHMEAVSPVITSAVETPHRLYRAQSG